MVVSITPDPKHLRGGFAELKIDGAQSAGDPVLLSIFNSYQQKWLGPDGWQPVRSDLTAREAHQDAETLCLILGPDIVNHIEEDTPIRIEIGAQGWDTYWPDDINAGPDEAVVGDMGGTGLAPGIKKPTVVRDLTPEVEPAPETEPPEPETSDPSNALESHVSLHQRDAVASATAEVGDKSRISLILSALALLLTVALAVYFFLIATEEAPERLAETAEPVESTQCGLDTLSAQQDEGFATLAGIIRACGGKVSADDALRLLEQATAANDPNALDLFGVLYDNTVTDAGIENTIGLTFSDDPARAAGYYARAATAGSADAPARLRAICRRLLLKSDTLSQSAREDHCS